jgi:hypothetical protein
LEPRDDGHRRKAEQKFVGGMLDVNRREKDMADDFAIDLSDESHDRRVCSMERLDQIGLGRLLECALVYGAHGRPVPRLLVTDSRFNHGGNGPSIP